MAIKKNRHAEIIQTLNSGNFYFECPNSSEDISLKKAILFDNHNFTDEALAIYQQQLDNRGYPRHPQHRVKALPSKW